MKRTTSFILACLMLTGAVLSLFSCGQTEKTQSETSAVATVSETDAPATETAVETTASVVFPDYDGGGSTFTVYNRSGQSAYNAEYIIGDYDGDVVNNATYKRNCELEDRYNIKIQTKDASSPTSKILSDIKAGTIDYDIVLDKRNSTGTVLLQGGLQDFNNLGVDMTTSWWDKNCIRDLSIGGKLYMMQNSVSIARFAGLRFLYYNKQIVIDYKLDDPYEMLANDTWTLDRFIEMCKGVENENGATELGVHAFVLETAVYQHMLVGCGVSWSKGTDDGELVCTIDDQIEKIDTIYDKFRTVFDNKNYTLTMDEAVALDAGQTVQGTGVYDQARSLFAQGHFLFTHGSIGVSSCFIEMQDDYGCMPNPKYNEDQDEYVHNCDPNTIIFSIPNDNSIDLTRLGLVMDYWAYLSDDTVTPAYYEITIKSKRVQESTASQVIDIVRNTAKNEISGALGISNLSSAINKGYTSGGFASIWKSYSAAVNAQIKKYNSILKALEK